VDAPTVKCDFCDATLGGDLKGFAGRRSGICRNCLETCLTIIAAHEAEEFEAMVERAREGFGAGPN
jgi:hypothetical protein